RHLTSAVAVPLAVRAIGGGSAERPARGVSSGWRAPRPPPVPGQVRLDRSYGGGPGGGALGRGTPSIALGCRYTRRAYAAMHPAFPGCDKPGCLSISVDNVRGT